MAEIQYSTVDPFDRAFGELKNLPDVTASKPSTVTAAVPIIGKTQTFIIQTLRQADVGDTIFLQYLDADGSKRIAIPPAAANAIARQRDALTTKVRKRIGKQSAEIRRASGKPFGFQKAAK